MQLVINIIFWFVFWWTIFGYFNLFLIKNGVGYRENYISTCLYFLFASLLAIFIFNFEISLILTRFKALGLIFLTLFLVAQYFLYRYLSVEQARLEFEESQLLPVSYKFFISKSFEVVFQVLMEGALIGLLFSNGISPLKGIILFSLLFGMAHLPLTLVSGLNEIIKIFVISSFIFSGFLAFLVLKFSYGIVFVYVIHWLFYFFFALLFFNYKWFRELVLD